MLCASKSSVYCAAAGYFIDYFALFCWPIEQPSSEGFGWALLQSVATAFFPSHDA
jgi:hypothetical protein